MRQTLLAAAAFVIGGIATGAVLSHAQPAPSPPLALDGPPPHPGTPGPGTMGPGMPGPGAMGWHHHMMRPGMREGMMHHHPFALIYRQEDRQLTPADVQKIAEGFLLWNGNHAWKVSDVAPTPEGPVAFSLTTPEGSVVAKFTMDPHTGHIQRVG